jgi:formamidopyrimidine-DNA glycosylase
LIFIHSAEENSVLFNELLLNQMPELPEVETTMRGLAGAIKGRKLTAVRAQRMDLRFPLPAAFASRLQGQVANKLDRRAKYILVRFEGGLTWLIHLGMSGRLIVGKGPLPQLGKHDHVALETDIGYVIYQDARRFGFMDLFRTDKEAEHPRLKDLGLEPLTDLNFKSLSALLSGRSSSVKAALLDQKLIVGLGNIYVAEALFRAKVRPEREAGSLTRAETRRLAASIPEVLAEAIKAGGSSLKDYRQPSGELGYFKASWAVYGREGEDCYRCGSGVVSRVIQSGRSSFYCPKCQR